MDVFAGAFALIPTTERFRRRLRAAPWLAALLLPLLVLFAPALAGRTLAFRDVTHYYRPLYELVAHEWRAGRVPLWNPYENAGQPLMADSTAAVWYPLQLLFFLPIDVQRALTLYVVAHLLLAGCTLYAAARIWCYSPAAAALAGISYALSGYVLFQYCNPPYLVGASWLPIVLVAVARTVERQGSRWLVLLAFSLAMMVLGGDPQGAYHAGIAALIYGGLVSWRRRRLLHRATLCPPVRRIHLRLARLLAAATLAALLAAVQILPSLEFARRSTRTLHDGPRSIWHVLRGSGDWQQRLQNLVDRPEVRSHDEQVYRFSVPPWRLAEFVWPNVSGRMFPVHQRWAKQLGEHQVWNPSLYVGWVPFLFALYGLATMRRRRAARWWGVMLVLAVLASFGEYSAGWLWDRLGDGRGKVPRASFGALGGAYWMLVTLLPGYSSFRYPAKWLALATCAASLLAAHGFDHWRRRAGLVRRRSTPAVAATAPASQRLGPVWINGGGIALSVLGLLLAVVLASAWSRWLADAEPDRVFGPLDIRAAGWDVISSMVQHLLVALAAALIMGYEPLRRRAAWWFVGLTACDLVMAHHWQIATAPPVDRDSAVCRLISEDKDLSDGVPVRVYRDGSWRPAEWSRRASADRFREILAWDRETLWPKYHLDCGPRAVSLLGSAGAMELADFRSLMRAAEQSVASDESRRALRVSPEWRAVWGTEYVLMAKHKSAGPSARRIANGAAALAVAQFDDSQPRAWLVRDVTVLPELARPLRRAAVERRAREVLYDGERPRDLRRTAVVEASNPERVANEMRVLSDPEERADAEEECRIVEYNPQRVRVTARVHRPALLVLSDSYYPGWRVTVRSAAATHAAEIWRTNGAMRGVLLRSAGDYEVVFEYRPSTFYLGAACSLLTLAGLTTLLLYRQLKAMGVTR